MSPECRPIQMENPLTDLYLTTISVLEQWEGGLTVVSVRVPVGRGRAGDPHIVMSGDI